MAAMLDVEINLTTRATTNVSKDLAAFANSSVRSTTAHTAHTHHLLTLGWSRRRI